MAKAKRPNIQRRPLEPTLDQRQAGLRAFHAGRFSEAIAAWSGLAGEEKQLRAALAEAHFRRALDGPPSDAALGDLRRALELVPEALPYRFHLGRYLHLQGDLAGASRAYQEVLARDPSWHAAGRLLALATLETAPRGSDAALAALSSDAQAFIAPAQALLAGRQPAADDSPPGRFWHGLSRLQRQEPAAALDNLSDSRPLPRPELTTQRRYYQGVAAAQLGNEARALQLWLELGVSKASPVKLEENLVALAVRRLNALYDAGDAAGAELALKTVDLVGGSAFDELRILALDRGARLAAEADDWPRAVALWEAARGILSRAAGLGSPRPLLHNLALGYERLERWEAAADAWRAMLRTRPRRRAGPQGPRERSMPPELSAQHWSWVRGRIISCYKHAGRPDEAVIVFRQMIKDDPSDLDLRVELADALRANGQERAADNEIARVLERDPQHVDALVRRIGFLDERHELTAAEQVMRGLIERHPAREDLRQMGASLWLNHGQQYAEWGQLSAAQRAFAEGEQLDPDNYQFPLNQARILLAMRRGAEAPPLIARALSLAGDDPEALEHILETWVMADRIDEARALIADVEGKGLPAATFAALGIAIIMEVTPPPPPPSLAELFGGPVAARPAAPTDTPWTRLAIELFDRAVALQPDDPQLFTLIASQLMLPRSDLARPYAETGVRLAPEDPSLLMLLGLIQGLNDEPRAAKATLRRAAQLARRRGDRALAEQAQEMSRAVALPMFRGMIQMSMMGLDPDDLDELDLYPFDGMDE